MTRIVLSVGEPIEPRTALCPPCWANGIDSPMRPAGGGKAACGRCGQVWPPDDIDGEDDVE